MKGEDRRWSWTTAGLVDGNRLRRTVAVPVLTYRAWRVVAYERFLARFSCVRHLEWGLATNRGGHARGRTWISPPASFDVPGRSEVRGTAILRDRSGSQVALWLENRRCAGVGITLFHVRSPGEVLSLSPVTMHAYDCRDVASIEIFYMYIYIYISVYFFSWFVTLFIFLFFVYLFIFSNHFWLIDFWTRPDFSLGLAWNVVPIHYFHSRDWSMGKKRKRRTSLFTEIGGHRFRIYSSWSLL